MRPLWLPLFCLALAVIEGALYAAGPFGVYAETGVISGVALVRFLSPLAVDYLCLGLLLATLWWRHWSSTLACCALAMLFAALHFAQYKALQVSGEFISVIALHFANQADYLIDRQLLVSLGQGGLALAGALCFVLWGMRLPRSSVGQRASWALLCSALLGLLLWDGFDEEREALRSQHGIEFSSPVGALWQTVRAAGATELEPQLSLSQAVIDQARLRGIQVQPERYRPFAKELVYEHPLPFPDTGATEQPNLLLLFIESLSAAVLPAYGAPHDGLTPNIDDFASHSMRVDSYLNHTTPSILGLRGQLCSNYPRLQHFDWVDSEHKPKTGKLLCLPEVLARLGYDTIYLSHARAADVFLQSQFLDMGVRETHFKETIMADYLPDEKPDRVLLQQPGDVQMFKILVRYLEERESDTPFFLSMSTIETHLASDVAKGARRYGDGQNPVLNVFHQLDRGFGIFWEWFQQSRYAENTILVVTGDHAMLPHEALRRVAGPAFRNHRFDHMALFILDPTHELPKTFRANTTSIDLTPSLLQLLKIQRQPNAFLGRSMFSDRSDVRGGFAFAWGRDMTDWKSESELFTVSTKDCEKHSHQLEELAATGWAAAQACLMYPLLRYAHQMEKDNRMWIGPGETTP